MLVELGLLEQRYQAVTEVLRDGASVVDVARRYNVTRQTVHNWIARYNAGGIAALADRSARPRSCPHQTPAEVEAAVVEMRRAHPEWGPRRIVHELGRRGVEPVPSRSSVYRALVRHGLIDPTRRKRKRADFRRWERGRPMELWQMDVVGFALADGTKASIVTGVDDHSRFCISAMAVERATARPVVAALAEAMRRHGVPEAVLTDNGKVFTGRFGAHAGEVLFDRVCRENGVRHLLTAPRSPTTTGKVERLHKTMRAELLSRSSFVTVADAQAALDAWVEHYNNERPHQGIGMATPASRFRAGTAADVPADLEPDPLPADPLRIERVVSCNGQVRYAAAAYSVGRRFAGQVASVSLRGALVEVFIGEVLVGTFPRRHDPAKEARPYRSGAVLRMREASVKQVPEPGVTGVKEVPEPLRQTGTGT